ncbi:MAG: hypothetical protein QXR45_12905, partial [Candidatus Bathyarchaeia archaeon]
AGSYKTLCSGIIKGLELLGLSSISLIPPGSIFVQGKKISGSAQLRRRNVILHHGTLLINSDLNMLKKVLYNKEKRRESTSIWSPVTNIRDELNREITMTEIKNVLIRGFKESLGIELESRNIESVENDIASKIYYTKYLILE